MVWLVAVLLAGHGGGLLREASRSGLDFSTLMIHSTGCHPFSGATAQVGVPSTSDVAKHLPHSPSQSSQVRNGVIQHITTDVCQGRRRLLLLLC